MAYLYPEALNGIQKIVADYFRIALPGKRVNVKVVADSVTGTASVDWGRSNYSYLYDLQVVINMPVRPAQYRMTENEFQHWAAYALHEVGHPLHTDKAVWDEAVAKRQHRMLNAVEDVRQEKRIIDAGLALNAKAAFSALVDSLMAKAWADGYDPNAIASFGWTIAVLGRAQNGYQIDVQGVWRALRPTGGVKQCLDWALPRLALCVTTRDCLDLANEISAFLAKFKAKDEGGEATGKAKDAREGEKAPAEGEAAESEPAGSPEARGGQNCDRPADGEKGDGEKGDEEKGDEEKAGEANEAGGRGLKGGAGKEEEPAPLTDADFDDAGLQPNSMDNMEAGNRDAHVQQAVTEVMREGLRAKIAPKEISGRAIANVSRGLNSVEYVEAMSAKMGRQRALLARALKREEEDTFEGGRQHGRFDSRRISKALQGDPHVFGRRVLSEGYDTDVQILVDGSGSMAGHSILASSVLALVVAQAARQVGVDCTAHVFNDHGLHEATKGKAKPVAKKFAYMINQIMGGTPLCESMIMAARLQAGRARGKRKVMFLVTDGGDIHGPAVIKGIGDFIERQMGIEIANLHIGRTPMGVFRNECAVDVRKVGEVGLQRLTATLERGI
jgi:hypothetical protein